MIPFFLFAQRRALTRLCRDVQPDLIYAHWYMPQGVIAQGVSRRLNIPFMFTTHASDVSVLGRLPFSKRIIATGLRQASLFTAVSRRTAKKLMDFFSEDEWEREFASKLTVIPMGTQSIQSDLDFKEAQRHLIAAGVVDTRKSILALGRLSEKKGLEYLIDAYSMLDPHIKAEYKLVIAGDGQLMTQLRNQVVASGQQKDIAFTGYVSGTLKASLFQLADIFVLPSIVDSDGDSEGLPVALMEALSYGKLIVATNVSGAEEVLHQDCGILVNQKSAVELAAAITDLANLSLEDRNSQVSEARLLAVRFDWKQVALKYLALIKTAIVSKCQ
jgi:glycosyltransferase involved in cell wall biosynthesis